MITPNQTNVLTLLIDYILHLPVVIQERGSFKLDIQSSTWFVRIEDHYLILPRDMVINDILHPQVPYNDRSYMLDIHEVPLNSLQKVVDASYAAHISELEFKDRIEYDIRQMDEPITIALIAKMFHGEHLLPLLEEHQVFSAYLKPTNEPRRTFYGGQPSIQPMEQPILYGNPQYFCCQIACDEVHAALSQIQYTGNTLLTSLPSIGIIAFFTPFFVDMDNDDIVNSCQQTCDGYNGYYLHYQEDTRDGYIDPHPDHVTYWDIVFGYTYPTDENIESLQHLSEEDRELFLDINDVYTVYHEHRLGVFQQPKLLAHYQCVHGYLPFIIDGSHYPLLQLSEYKRNHLCADINFYITPDNLQKHRFDRFACSFECD